jgi:hypothetical protein
MRLNGWQRFWICLSILAIAPVAIATWKQLPSPASVGNSWDFYDRLPESSRAKLLTEASDVLDPEHPTGPVVTASNDHPLIFRGGVTGADANIIAAQYNDILRTEAIKRDAALIGVALAVWLCLCAALYAIGWSIAWIRRGFRND